MLMRLSVVVGMVLSSPLHAQQPPAAIARDLQQKLAPAFGTVIVAGELRITMDEPKVSESAYLTMLSTACAHLGARATVFDAIVVVNRAGNQGFVYETPAKCAAVAKTPLTKVRPVILADTHLQ